MSLGRVVEAYTLFAWQAYTCPADAEDAPLDVLLSMVKMHRVLLSKL